MTRWLIGLLGALGLLLVTCSEGFAQTGPHKCDNTASSVTFCWATAGRPVNPLGGVFGFNTDTSTYEAYNGTNWITLSPGAFDVRAFGAVGNDTGNQAPAINLAIAAATAAGVGAVYIPSGTYRIQASASATSRINAASNMTIYGDGAGSTIIDCDDTVAAFAGNFACMGIHATALNNFTLRGVTLKGKALTSPIGSGFGLLQLTPGPTGNQYNCNNIRIEDNEFLESRYFGMAIKACVGVIVRNNHVAKTARDGIDVWDSANVLITGNRIENSNDDSISCQQSAYSQAGTLVAPEPSGCTITNNTIIESQGITSYGSKLTVISNNVIKRSTGFGIAADAFMTSVGGEPSPATSTIVTGNVVSDIFCRPGADTYNANCLYLQIGGGPKKVKIPAYGAAGTSGLYYAIDADVDATSPGGVMFNIGNNVLSRTLPPNSTGFSDWGFNPSGWWTCKFRNPAAGTTGIDDITCGYVNTSVAEANLNVTAVRFRGALSKSKLHNNIVDTSGIAVQFAGAADTPTDLDYDLEITNNQFLNCNLTTGNGCINWSYGTTLYQRILIKGNVFDGDPRFVASLRGAAGTWTSTGIPVAIGMDAVSGLSIIDNIFRNFNQINTGTGTNYVTGNIVYADPVGGVGCSSSNVGVRCIPASNTGYTTLQEDSAPASATYGKLLSSDPAISSTVDVMAYGAKCDGATDDSTAINNAINAARTLAFNNSNFGGMTNVVINFPESRVCAITSPIDMTAYNGGTINVYNRAFVSPGPVFRNARIRCLVAGGICIDAIGSGYILWDNVQLSGGTGVPPTIGILIGRVDPGVTAPGHKFRNVSMTGSFKLAALYALASEVFDWEDPYITNVYVTTGIPWGTAGHDPGYAVILDGLNHFGAGNNNGAITTGFISTFRTITLPGGTLAAEAYDGFNDVSLGPGKISAVNAATMWIGGAGPVRMSTYVVASTTVASCNVVIYAKSNVHFNNDGLTFRSHFEAIAGAAGGIGVQNHFCFDGPAVNPVFNNFTFTEENGAQAETSVFKISGSAATVDLRGAYINYSKATNPAVVNQVMLDQPTKYNISGFVALLAATEWVKPLTFTGTLCLAGLCDQYLAQSTVTSLTTNFPCNAARAGIRRYVTNQATASAYRGAITDGGGGGTGQFVYCNGTAWLQD